MLTNQKQMQPPPMVVRLSLALVGGFIGLAVATSVGLLALYFLSVISEAIFGPSRLRHASVKAGIAVVVVPLAGAIWGVVIGWNLHEYRILNRARAFLDRLGMLDRAAFAWGVVWIAFIGTVISLTGPFWRGSRYWYLERDGLATALWLLIPTLGGFAIARLVAWVSHGSR